MSTEKDLDPEIDDGPSVVLQVPSCAVCGKSDSPLKKCSQCSSIFYCSVDCQKQDWKSHKNNCINAEEYIRKQMDQKTLKYDDFEVIKKLGDGNFTQVFQVIHKKFPKGQNYALKICEIQKVENMRRENDILLEKHSLNKIREKYAKEMPSVKIIATFKDHLNLYFLTEIFKSKLEIWEHCRSFGLLQDDLIRYCFLKICQQVMKLHDIGIIHRDLKPENMFFTDDEMNGVKLIDFGSSDDLEKPELRRTFINNDPKRGMHEYFVGTSQYMAPECVHNKPTEKCSDVWSMGCILYQLYIGLPPFRGASDYLIFRLSSEADFLKLDEYDEQILPEQAKELIKQMVRVPKDERITIEQVVQSSFFEGVRHLSSCPLYSDTNRSLKDLCQDFITRGNVHRFSGKTEFETNFQKKREEYPEEKIKMQHIYEQAKMFIFDEDPQNEKIEEVKKQVQEMSKAAREKQEESGSESETEGQEPEEPFSSMGCKFNPEDVKKLKKEDEEAKN